MALRSSLCPDELGVWVASPGKDVIGEPGSVSVAGVEVGNKSATVEGAAAVAPTPLVITLGEYCFWSETANEYTNRALTWVWFCTCFAALRYAVKIS